MSTEPARGRRAIGVVLGVVVAVALAALAFIVFDAIIGAGVAIVLATVLAIAVAASGWDQHSTYEERELVRARRRQEKWDRNKDARERDRRRWEAHQARTAGRQTAGQDDQR